VSGEPYKRNLLRALKALPEDFAFKEEAADALIGLIQLADRVEAGDAHPNDKVMMRDAHLRLIQMQLPFEVLNALLGTIGKGRSK
jgi:hypothetical protein